MKHVIFGVLMFGLSWVTTGVMADLNRDEQMAEAPRILSWDDLVPADYTPDVILSKYQDQIDQLEDGTPEADALYDVITTELLNAPANKMLDQQWIKLPGFLAPLDIVDGQVTSFLLVPYFGACIHVPPPPPSQTVWVSVAANNEIPLTDSFLPYWIYGQMAVESTDTDIGSASFRVKNAVIEPYTEE